MSKKTDSFYFENFIACTQLSCEAAHLLEQTMEHFDPAQLPEKLDEIHAVERAADEKKHELSDALVKAFITPIEREDITLLSQCIDELTDKIEDVLICIYYNNMKTVRPETLSLAKVVVHCCEAVREMMVEFADFKHSKKLHEHIIHINTMEEEADALFISSMHELHNTSTDALEIIACREVYMYLEKCADACEHVADVVESVVMKNS